MAHPGHFLSSASVPINYKNPTFLNLYVQAIARTLYVKYLPVNEVTVLPDAEFFPGLPSAGASPVQITALVNGTTPGNGIMTAGFGYWQCLGANAMPGIVVTVTVPDSIAQAGAMLLINGATDTVRGTRRQVASHCCIWGLGQLCGTNKQHCNYLHSTLCAAFCGACRLTIGRCGCDSLTLHARSA